MIVRVARLLYFIAPALLCVATAEATTTKDDAKSELKSEGADSKPDNELLIVSRHGSSCVSARDVRASGCL